MWARNFPFPHFWADCAEFIIPYRSEHGLSEILALQNELVAQFLQQVKIEVKQSCFQFVEKAFVSNDEVKSR